MCQDTEQTDYPKSRQLNDASKSSNHTRGTVTNAVNVRSMEFNN